MTADIDTLKDQRDELDISLGDTADALADHHDLAASTLSTYLSEWERGDRDPTEEDLAALETTLDEIEAEQNFEYPPCTGCGRTPQLDIVYIDGDPYCLVCTYTDPDEDIPLREVI
jgi:transcriptional regulator with XRE-family HTH domain